MSDLNTLMLRIQDINQKGPDELSSDDIDVLITYHRHNRARKAAGEKAEKPKVDLGALLNIRPKAPEAIVTRRL